MRFGEVTSQKAKHLEDDQKDFLNVFVFSSTGIAEVESNEKVVSGGLKNILVLER